jgi:hypothetical protein
MRTDDEIRDWLQRVFREASGVYPFPEGAVVDPRYAMALGLIVGVAHEALASVSEDRPMRITVASEKRSAVEPELTPEALLDQLEQSTRWGMRPEHRELCLHLIRRATGHG